MVHVITGSCCNDAVCVSVCPMNCISPTPDSPEFLRSGMLHINPEICIDCGACADACPVAAIVPIDFIAEEEKDFIQFNAEYFKTHSGKQPVYLPAALPLNDELHKSTRVAVVGSGPSAMYAIHELNIAGVKQISVFEKADHTGGLVYSGVAPDRTYTKNILNLISRTLKDIQVDLFLNVEVGKDISVDDLRASHDAIVFSTGARADKLLGVPGEDLPECYGIRTFAGWYNGVAGNNVERIVGPRAVVVGHGNTALDATRFLSGDLEYLNKIRMPSEVKKKLLAGNIKEVVLLGRDNPNGPAFSRSALHELKLLNNVKVVIDADSIIPQTKNNMALNWLLKEFPQEKVDYSKLPDAMAERRVIIRFGAQVTEIVGKNHIEQVNARTATGENLHIPASTVIRSIGYRNLPIPTLPFDAENNIVPNDNGCILMNGAIRPGLYVTGWLKRGTVGGIGHNKSDSLETVNALVDHANRDLLPSTYVSFNSFVNQIETNVPNVKVIKKATEYLSS